MPFRCAAFSLSLRARARSKPPCAAVHACFTPISLECIYYNQFLVIYLVQKKNVSFYQIVKLLSVLPGTVKDIGLFRVYRYFDFPYSDELASGPVAEGDG